MTSTEKRSGSARMAAWGGNSVKPKAGQGITPNLRGPPSEGDEHRPAGSYPSHQPCENAMSVTRRLDWNTMRGGGGPAKVERPLAIHAEQYGVPSVGDPRRTPTRSPIVSRQGWICW